MIGESSTKEAGERVNAEEALRLDGVAVGELSAIELTVAPGEILCLSGASGSGKSRLLRAVADLEPHAGEVWLGDRAQSAMPAHEWRRRVMLVPAESHWWAATVGEHLAAAVQEGDLESLGFDREVLAWEVTRLSSGEKQRLALLRALALLGDGGREPSALLLDEPTANLDEASTRSVETWLVARIREHGWPTLWVAHDRGQIGRVADRHYVLQHGRLQAGRLAEEPGAWT